MLFCGCRCCCCCRRCCRHYPDTWAMILFSFSRFYSLLKCVQFFFTLTMLCLTFEGDRDRERTRLSVQTHWKKKTGTKCASVCIFWRRNNDFHENQFHSQNKRRLPSNATEPEGVWEKPNGMSEWMCALVAHGSDRSMFGSGANGHFSSVTFPLNDFSF